jgi:glycosyltransferase involved in cell wall biosynthesis
MASQELPGVRVAILVFPFAPPSIFTFARKLAVAVASHSTHTIVVSGGLPNDFSWPQGVQIRDIGVRLHYLKEKWPKWLSTVLWIAKFVWAQIMLAWQVFELRHEIDVIICSVGCYYQLPILMARVLGMKLVCAALGLDSLSANASYGRVMATFISLMMRFNFALSDVVLVESLRLGTCKDLVPFRSKLCNGALFLDEPERFQVKTEVNRRQNLVGYVGRLAAEKGVLEFVQAIPLALQQQSDLRFLIIGTGELEAVLDEFMQGKPWDPQVKRLKWIDHEHIPNNLNQLKLIVLPSYSEGLPNVALEAMGCGTPVLASSVGGIPDLITDGETGFLLEDNSPPSIADGIVRAVNDPCLEIVAQRARALVEREYNLSAAASRYETIIRAVAQEREFHGCAF